MKKNIIVLIGLCIFGLYSCRHEQKVDLKIMSYNIRHGEGLDKKLDVSRSAKIIKAQTLDLCGLQEVDNFCTRSDSIGQTNYLAEKTNMKGTFGKFMDFQGGEYGMATLVAKPILSTKVLILPDAKYEPRSSIVHEVQLADNCIITFANVHFEWISGEEGSANRLKQAKTLVKYIDKLDRATIITGDFNCTPESETMQYFKEQGFVFVQKGDDNLSFQGAQKAEIDHLIFRDSDNVKFEIKNSFLLDEPLVSDHRPLITELKLVF